MSLRSPSRIALLLIAAISATVCTSISKADSSGFSGLEGTELSPATSLIALGAKLLSRGDGKIDSVRVVEDRAGSLAVEISYSNLGSADCVMTVTAADRRLKSLSGIEPAKVNLSSAAGQVSAKLTMDESAAEGTKLDQTYLLIQVNKPSLYQPFDCRKKWEKPVAPEHLVITAVAEPVRGGATEKLTKPSGTLAPVFSPTIFRPKLATPKAGLQPKPQPKPQATRTMILKPMVMKPVITKTAGSQATPAPGPSKNIVAIKSVTLLNPKVLAGLPPTAKNDGAKGPSPVNRIPLFELVKTEVSGLDAAAVTDIKGDVYADSNEASGYYYYLPRGYYLDWSEEAGYGLRFLYGQQNTEDQSGTVKVQASLTSGVDSSDAVLISDLLEQYCKASGLPPFKKLRPFPFDAPPDGISISLKGDLSPFNVPPEKVSVNGITEIGDKIEILFATDDRDMQDFQVALTQGLGLSGTMAFNYGSGAGQVSAPANVSVKLRDPQSFANRIFRRGNKFHNPSPYPVKLKYVHVLAVEQSGDHYPIVYSYRLRDSKAAAGDEDGVVVPAGASVDIDARKIPSWLDSTALRMWIEYSVMADAEADQKVMDAATGGVVASARSQITFWTLQTALSSVNAEFVLATVRSRYFDPQGVNETTKTLKLDKDDSTFTLGPLYLGDQQPGGSTSLYSYRLTVVKPDGTTSQSAQWKTGTGLEVMIGPIQLREALGITDESSDSTDSGTDSNTDQPEQ